MKKTVVFMVGAGHCGSTLLALILGSHSKAFALGELHAFQNNMASGRLSGPVCQLCSDECRFWSSPDLTATLESYFAWAGHPSWLKQQIYGRVGSFGVNLYATLFEKSGADLLIDSSKDMWWIRRQLRPKWQWRAMRPFLIYMVRDGRAVVNSYRRKYPTRSVEKLATEWADATVRMEQFYHSFPEQDRALVSYEKLTTEPALTIRALCERLEVPFESGMLEYWRHDHHLLYGNAGTRSLIQEYRGQDTAYADHAFYAETGLDIRPDFRWRQELDSEQVATFEQFAGERNRPYAFDEDLAGVDGHASP